MAASFLYILRDTFEPCNLIASLSKCRNEYYSIYEIFPLEWNKQIAVHTERTSYILNIDSSIEYEIIKKKLP